MIYTDDNYYLLAYEEKAGKFKHFRADKMDSVQTLEADRIGKEAFDELDMANYTKYTFSMFGGEPEIVTMVFQNRMMGAVMDRFGSDIVAMKEDNTHFRVSVSVAVSQQFFAWVFGLGKAVRIVAPESVKEQMKKALDHLTVQLAEKDKELKQLRADLESKNIHIAELDKTNLTSTLNSARANLLSARANLQSAEANRDYQLANYNRYKTLYQKGLVSADEY